MPDFGRSTAPHAAQEYTITQASIGIVSRRTAPQIGQVITDSVIKIVFKLGAARRA